LSLADFRRVNDINLKGPFLGLKHAEAALRRRGGSVIMVASIAGKIGVADHIHYTASKAGVRLLAKAAALELGPARIRVNTLHPGFVRTGMSGDFDPATVASAPLRRAGEPEEVAEAALFLASDRSAFMTGAEIVIDGGWTVR
jgi:3alpha(or 20beta)-hydroxysteroid dehydrogenase